MKKPVCDVLVVSFCYGGNGGISSTIPELAQWTTRTILKMKQDDRIGRIEPLILSDTPITMTRNRAVKIARDKGYDFILMLDSDNEPDGYLNVDPNAKPFWDVAFDFSYDRLLKGMPTCIAAPYCGPPPHPVEKPNFIDGGEVPYLFQWSNKESHDPNAPNKLDILTRAEAAKLSGIYPVAALPTGVCLFTTNCFDGPPKPYFKYEWMDEDNSEKASTEDVYATRNISLYWSITKGWDVCFATCDSWALHFKPKRVGKPYLVPVESVAKNMREALESNFSVKDRLKHVDFTEGLELPKRGGIIKAEPDELVNRDTTNWSASTVAATNVDPSTLKRRWEKLGPEDDMIYISDEEWTGLAALEKAEAAASVTLRDPPFPDNDTNIDDTDIDGTDDGVSPIVDSNGQLPVRSKMIGQRRAVILEYELSDPSIDCLQTMTRWLVGKLGGGIDVAIVHPGTGQGTAAIAECLPPMSRILAFDSVSQYHSGEYAKHFMLTFQKELENGAIKADVDGKSFPSVKNYKVDMAFIENFVTGAKLDAWYKAVSPKGVLCGTGYSQEGTKAVITAFREKHKLPIQANGDVWVLPVGGIVSVHA